MGRGHIENNTKVRVERKKLIETLKVNRGEHQVNFNKAMRGYRETLTAVLEELGKAASAEAERVADLHTAQLQNFDTSDLTEKLSDLRSPTSYQAAYDEAIALYEWDTREEIELTYPEFRKFVLDKWDWKADFLYASSRYIGG